MFRVLSVGIVIIVIIISCKPKEQVSISDPYNEIRDFTTFWNYYNNNIFLEKNYYCLDSTSKKIGRKEFLEQLSSGKVFPFRETLESRLTYKLYPINSEVDNNIITTLGSIGQTQYKYYAMEGKKLPQFTFKDLLGTTYTNKNTKGKVVVIKTWFINCKACISEMPLLNDIHRKFSGRKVVFLSLALDTEDSLKGFLKRIKFSLPVIANQSKFITDSLKLYSYPTHIIVNSAGDVVRILEKVDAIDSIITHELDIVK